MIKIDIHLTISEETVQDLMQGGRYTKESLIQNIISCLEEDMGSAISDNQELFATQTFEVE